MQRYSFATIITSNNDIPLATQLPFTIEDCSGKLILKSHFSHLNEQVKYIKENQSLIIFSEPHAYISPRHYEKKESVPTWDYVSVHAYGKAEIIEEEKEKLRVIEEMIVFYEKEYLAQWEGLSEKYKKGMLGGLVAFQIEVTDLQCQKKLSQNKTLIEKQRIIQHLANSHQSQEKDLADYIKNSL